MFSRKRGLLRIFLQNHQLDGEVTFNLHKPKGCIVVLNSTIFVIDKHFYICFGGESYPQNIFHPSFTNCHYMKDLEKFCRELA